MRSMVQFGFDHVHSIDGKIFDKDCVGVISGKDPDDCRRIAFEYFGKDFCIETPEFHFNFDKMYKYFDRGFINVNF